MISEHRGIQEELEAIDREIIKMEEEVYNHALNIDHKHAATIRAAGEDDYSADCPACLRHRPHTDSEHEAALRRVWANSQAEN